jgi:hypothetical protein
MTELESLAKLISECREIAENFGPETDAAALLMVHFNRLLAKADAIITALVNDERMEP